MKKIALLLVFLFFSDQQNARLNYLNKKFLEKGFPPKEAKSILSDKRLKIFEIKEKPEKEKGKAIDWEKVTKKVMAENSVERGKQFLKDNQKILEEAEKKFGVPKEVIAAILRVETDFGKFPGSHSVANVFYNKMLVADNWEAAAQNFVALFVYAKNAKRDGFEIKGSYAGAFGLPQFLPSSALAYGISAKGKHQANLFNVDDSILSIANYLSQKGWAKDKMAALADYYGSGTNYPNVILLYADEIKSR